MPIYRFLFFVVLSFSALAADLSLLLAERYVRNAGIIDVSQYWVSEKLDGVRAMWDGRQLRFRSGNPVPAPEWFVRGLPPHQALDGELWLGRGTFEKLSGIVRTETPDDRAWRQVRYMIFELPNAPGSFTERIAAIRRLTAEEKRPWLQPVEQFRLPDKKTLQRKLDEVVRAGGEGLMLHRADAPYVTGRSPVLLKVTPWQDEEARVIAHLPGQGKFRGVLGALRVEMPNGKQFSLGTGFSEHERRHPPAIGAQVTYRYRELTEQGIPRFASYQRVRERF